MHFTKRKLIEVDLPEIIEAAFCDLDAFLRTNDWHGRENEVVNLYAHRFLAGQMKPGRALRSLRQVGIEVAVRQVNGSRKKYVRKDLVIWPEDDMTVWTEGACPAAIIEWKRNSNSQSRSDAEWLRAFRRRFPSTICYTACTNLVTSRGCQFRRID